jgi:hypothetical protein
MRTTLDLPDELFREVKAKAALEGLKLKELLTRYVERGLRHAAPAATSPSRSKLPVIKRRGKVAIPNLSAERQSRLEEEDDLAKLRRSFGR